MPSKLLNVALWEYANKQWFLNAHLWSVVFQGQRLFRSDAHVEVVNRIRKQSERSRMSTVRADVYAHRTASSMQSAAQQFIAQARHAAASDALSQATVADTHADADESADSLNQAERWSSRASLPAAELKLCKAIVRIQNEVHSAFAFAWIFAHLLCLCAWLAA